MTEGVNYVNPTCLATTKILKVEDMRSEDKCTWRLTRDLDSSKNSCEPGKPEASSGLP